MPSRKFPLFGEMVVCCFPSLNSTKILTRAHGGLLVETVYNFYMDALILYIDARDLDLICRKFMLIRHRY